MEYPNSQGKVAVTRNGRGLLVLKGKNRTNDAMTESDLVTTVCIYRPNTTIIAVLDSYAYVPYRYAYKAVCRVLTCNIVMITNLKYPSEIF